MRPSFRRARVLLTLAALACAFVVAAGDLHAGDDDKAGKSKKRDSTKVAKRGAKHLRYQKTYAAALREARIRNLPVFISRHKDF